MKYFTISSKNMGIIEVFDGLKDLRTKYSDLDISDYIDDLNESYNDMLFISENYLTTMLKQTKEEENKSSLRDMISLKEDLDEMTEQYAQANIEIETVHNEYIKVLESNGKNETKALELEKELKSLGEDKDKLSIEIAKLNADLKILVKENKERIDNIKKIMVSSFKESIEKELKEFERNLMDLEEEVNIYKGVN